MNADARFIAAAQDMGADFSGEIKIGGHYTPVMRDGHQLFVSGQIPRVGDKVLFVGAVGGTLDVAQGVILGLDPRIHTMDFPARPGNDKTKTVILAVSVCHPQTQDVIILSFDPHGDQ